MIDIEIGTIFSFVGVDAVSPEDVFVCGGEVAGGDRVFGSGADTDECLDVLLAGTSKEIFWGEVGRLWLMLTLDARDRKVVGGAVMEVAVGVDEIHGTSLVDFRVCA